MIEKLTSKFKCKNATTWKTQAINFTTTEKVNVNFYLSWFGATKILMCKFHINDSAEVKHNMIPGRYLLASLGLDVNFSKHAIVGGVGPYWGCMAPMANFNNYNF